MKKCSECSEEKDLSKFYNDKRTKDGKYSKCKLCHGKYSIYTSPKKTEEYREYRRNYHRLYARIRSRKDIQYKLRRITRTRTWNIIKFDVPGGIGEKYIGCTHKELVKHIESQFLEGMSWENWGKWEIDHIKPLLSFDLTSEEELLEASNYKNLRPVWSSENRYRKHKTKIKL